MLALTAGFVLLAGGWFLAGAGEQPGPRVTVSQREETPGPVQQEAQPGEEAYPDSLLPGEVIDLNTAGVYDLQRLPGIVEKRARDIIAYREEHGPFETVEELDLVSGIGPGIIEGLRQYASAG